MSIENEIINDKILSLWESKITPEEVRRISPLLYPEFKKNPDILFIGFNPSLSYKRMSKIEKNSKGTILENKNLKDILENYSRDRTMYITEIERIAKENINYFLKIGNIAKEIGVSWEHIDLFLFRKTNQEDAKKIIYRKKELNEFAKSQLKIVNEIIKILKPKLIVVVNALSSDIINSSKIFKIENKVFEERGYDLFGEDKIPIIFSSMLYGKRALDNHSLRRLKRNIRKILERLN